MLLKNIPAMADREERVGVTYQFERGKLKVSRTGLLIVCIWLGAVVLLGSALTSLHQPFYGPGEDVLALVHDPGDGNWRVLHVLSASCGCSQRVMRHLLKRHRLTDVTEQVLLIEGESVASPEATELITALNSEGFPVTRIAESSIPNKTNLHGVPLLVVASPENKIAYEGGYGVRGDEDGAVLQTVRAGNKMGGLPVVGCAVGRSLRRQADPFRLKY